MRRSQMRWLSGAPLSPVLRGEGSGVRGLERSRTPHPNPSPLSTGERGSWQRSLRFAACAARIASVVLLVLALTPPCAHAQDELSVPKHLGIAQKVLQDLDLKNTHYEHGQGVVTFGAEPVVRTDCSGFVDHLLMHTYGYTREDFKKWLKSERPTAKRYHDAIVPGTGFTHIQHVKNLKPGDFLAVKYLDNKTDTGHIMLVVAAPKKTKSGKGAPAGFEGWAVTIIDSSHSGHGPSDTRHAKGADGKDHSGLGQGVFRVYAGADGQVAGYSWSTLDASPFVNPEAGHLVIGRLKANFKP